MEIENIYDKRFSINYLTEKIFHGFLSCSVPIYLGCWNVEDLVHPNLFIDIRKFSSIKEVADHCEKMSDLEYKGYLDRICEFIHGPGLEFTRDRLFQSIDKELGKK